MFGQPNAPFGSGGFGQPTNTAPAFGSPAPAAGGLFGSPPAAPSGFGSPPAANTFGGGGMFGAPAPTGGFGSSFGAPAPAPFGAPAPAGGSLFGAPAPGGFGAPASGGFGAPAPSTASPFGAAPAPVGGFGAPAPQSGFGGGGFGAPASGGFGAPAPAAGGLFGAPATSPFTAAPAGFGAPASGSFGAPAGAFGAPAPAPVGGGLFGAPAPAAGGSLFGAPAAPQQQQGGGGGGTRAVPYQVTNRPDGASSINLQAITAMQPYEQKSFEELRFEDYSQGNRGSQTPTAPGGFGGGGGFGAPAAAPPAGGGLFGAPAPTPGAFGAPAPGGFGAPGAFGAPAPGAFGAPAPAGGGLFGAPAPAPGGFGSFGAPAPAPAGGGLFGAPAAAAPFGSPAPAPAPFGAPPAGGGLFGSNPAPAPFGAPAAGSLFGSSPAPAPFGAPAGGGLFGSSPAPAPYGAPPAGGGLFGAPAPTTSFVGFGAKPPGGGGLFGNPQPAPAPFGYPQQQQQPQQQAPYGYPAQQPPMMAAQPVSLFPPNSTIIPPATNEVLEQRLRAMEKERGDLEKMSVWGSRSSTTSPSVTPISLRGPSGGGDSMESTPVRLGFSSSSSPRSAAKIRPRGFPQSSQGASRSALVHDNSGLLSPEGHIRSSVMQLVIKPDSLKKRKPKLQLLLENNNNDAPPAQLHQTPIETITSPPPADTINRATVVELPSPAPPTPQTLLPPTSPGFDYYQQVIGSPTATTANAAARIESPVVPTTSSAAATPTLTKAGYDVVPSMDVLESMSEADLAAITGFCVHRRGYGKVEWEGSVDVRGADLDRIVSIEKQDVSVYTLEEQEGRKPPVGTKLNRPAMITFYNVFSKSGGPEANAEEKEKFARKVERTTRKIGADFLSYDQDTGVWIIRVHHFSRYGLLDDDTDDEAEQAKPTPLKSSIRRKATPYKPSRIAFSHATEMDGDDQLVSEAQLVAEVEMTEAEMRENVRRKAEQVGLALGREHRMSLSPRKEDRMEFEPVPRIVADLEEGLSDSEDEEMESSTILPPQESDILQAGKGVSICGRLRQRLPSTKSHVDVGARMGRSFRPCWLPNGSFLKIASQDGSPRLVQCKPALASHTVVTDPVPLLEIHKENSIAVKEPNECPHYVLQSGTNDPYAVHEMLTEFSSLVKADEAKHAFTLLSNLLDDQHVDTDGDTPGVVSLAVRRTAAIRKTLLDVCSENLKGELGVSSADVLSSVFLALASGNLEKACEVAMENSCSHLSVILASGLDGKKDLLAQVLSLADSGLMGSVSPHSKRVLNAVGGDAKYEDNLFGDGKSNLDWCRRLCLRLLNEPHKDMEEIVATYEIDLAANKVPFPDPSHGNVVSNHVHSLLYRLLLVCADPTKLTMTEVADPRGLATHVHDFSASFHLVAAISATNEAGKPSMSTHEAESIQDGYEAQLISQGLWEWAVFVALSSLGESSPETIALKRRRAKTIVLRNCGKDDRSKAARSFLENEVGVPSAWFEEALSYRAAAQGDLRMYIIHALAYSLPNAVSVLDERVLPFVFFLPKEEWAQMKDVLEAAASDTESLSMTMLELFRLDSSVMRLGIDANRSQLDDLWESTQWLEMSLKAFQSQRTNVGPLLPSSAPKTVSLQSMLSEASLHLRFLKAQLEAATATYKKVPSPSSADVNPMMQWVNESESEG